MSDNHYLYAFGPVGQDVAILFSTNLPITALDRDTHYRWATMNRLGKRPGQQFVGLGEDIIQIQGTVYPTFATFGGDMVGIKELDKMRDLASTGAPVSLVDGMGQTWGTWVIKHIRERATHHLPNGAPRKQEFTCELHRYGEDLGAVTSTAIQNNSSGLISVPRIDGTGLTQTA